MIGWLFLSVVLVSKSSVSGTNLTHHSALQETTTAASFTTESWTADTTNPATGSVKSSTMLSALSTIAHDVSTSFNVISTTANDTLISRTEPEPGTLKPEGGTLEPEAGTLEPEAGTLEPEAGTLEPEAGTLEPETGTLESDYDEGDYPDGFCYREDDYTDVICDSQHYCCVQGSNEKKCCPKLPAGAIFGIVSSSIVICMFLVCCFVASCRWCDVCPYRKVRVARKMSISSAIYNRGERQITELPPKEDYQQNASSDNVNEPAKPIEDVDDIDLKVSGAENQDPFTAITLSEYTVV